MSNSAHMAARNALVALLQGSPALAGITVAANYRRPMPAAVNAMVFVYLRQAQPAQRVIGQVDWRTSIAVESVSRDQASLAADLASDAMATAVHAAVMANRSLSGTAIDTDAGPMAWIEDELDTTVAAVQQLFSVQLTTADETIAA